MRCYRFEDYEVNAETGHLWRGQQEIPLRNKCRQLLLFFLAHPQEQVTRDQLIDGIWQGEVTADAALSKTVAELRRALGDDPKQARFLETLPKVGYRWMVTVSLGEPQTTEIPDATPVVAAPTQQSTPARARWSLPVLGMALVFAVLLLAMFLPQRTTNHPEVAESQDLVTGESSTQPLRVVILPFENRTSNVAKDWLELGLPDFIGSIHNEAQHIEVVAINQVDKWLQAHKAALPLSPADLTALRQSFSAQVVVWATVATDADGFALQYGIAQAAEPPQAAILQGQQLIELAELLAKVIHESLVEAPFVNFNHAIYTADPSITQRYIEARTLNYAGQLRKAKARYQALVELAPDFLWAKTGLVSVMFSLGEFNEEYDQLLAQAEEQAKQQGSDVAQTLVLQLQAVRAMSTGNPVEALRIFQAMLDFPNIRDQDRAQVHLNMGAIHGELGEFDKERSSYERAMELGVNPYDRALILNNLGAIATDEERFAEGREVLEQALTLNRQLNELNAAGNNLLELGKNARLAGQPKIGADFYTQAIDLFQQNQNAFYEAEAWLGLGNCTRQMQQLETTMEHYVKARTILEKPAFTALPHYEKGMLSGLYVRLARLEAKRNKMQAAQQWMQKAIEAFDVMGNDRQADQLRDELKQWQQQTTG